MITLESALRRHNGVAHIASLVKLGISADAVQRASKKQLVTRVRPGIYALPNASEDVVRAARLGGRLAGVSAAAHHGFWDPARHPLVVEVPHSANRLHDPDVPGRGLDRRRTDVSVLWSDQRRPQAAFLGVAPVVVCLRQVALTASDEDALAILDSALRRSVVSRVDLDELAATVPSTRRLALGLATGTPESGTESMLLMALYKVGVTAVPQMRIPFTDFSRVDFLVGDRLVIECQSKEHHDQKSHRLRDLRRFADLAALGYIVLQFDYWQIVDELDLVVSTVLSYVDRGMHRSHAAGGGFA